MEGMAIAGADVSVTHGAIVAASLQQDSLSPPHPEAQSVVLVWSDKAKDVKAANELPGVEAFRVPKPDKFGSHRQEQVARRLVWLHDLFVSQVRPKLVNLAGETSMYLSLEDYALGAKGKVHEIAEVGGQFKTVLLTVVPDFHLRLHEPGTPKRFATGKHRAEKHEMISHAVGTYLFGGLFADLPDDMAEDVADAVHLFELTRLELAIKNGEVGMNNLGGGELAEARRRVFLRTTKAYPVNLLDRGWITAESLPSLK